jgi:hypothetical protein
MFYSLPGLLPASDLELHQMPRLCRLNFVSSVAVPTILRSGPYRIEVGAFYWTDMAPDIVNPGQEEQGSVSV